MNEAPLSAVAILRHIFPFNFGMRILLFLIGFSLLVFSARAQERCGSVEYEKSKHLGSVEKKEAAFEKWMNTKLIQRAAKNSERTQASTYTIPVVVHIIHNGEAVGTGTNLSDAQVQSQIDVMNEDYNRLNADASNTPTEFQSVAGSINIQFVLAKQDPFGLYTNGIVRVKGSKTSWTSNDDATFKALSYWRADRYVNIWVLNLTDYLGYSQFPSPNGTSLQGLNEPDMPHDSISDGLAIYYKAFGSGNFDLDSQYDKGRTATHEMGHYFGLRHIWGDNSNCSTTTDYVTDTPPQNASTNGCPTNPQISCTVHKMFQNYMDYTDDPCMNLFTQGQVSRMDIVINNAARRKSLLTSPGATPSGTQPLVDIALAVLKNAGPVLCVTNPAPQLTIQNKGNTPIQNFKVETVINNGSTISQSFTNADLQPGEEKDFTLNSLSLIVGTNKLQFTLSNPNGQADNADNNSLQANVIVNQATDIIPLRQNFDGNFSTNWSVVSPGGGTNWMATTTNYNKSLEFPAYGNPTTGQQSWLVSPTLDLSNYTQASVLFDVSYATRSTGVERLQVLSSEDCGVTYSNILYDLKGDEFSSKVSATSWLPSGTTDWQKQFISLDGLAGKQKVRIAFVVTNENGNNLFLDNLDFYETDDTNPPIISENYRIYATTSALEDYQITFNLEDRADVSIFVYNVLGERIAYHQLTNVLNQTFPIDILDHQTGIYILRMRIGSELHADKIFLAR
jgi:hypothetical protein